MISLRSTTLRGCVRRFECEEMGIIRTERTGQSYSERKLSVHNVWFSSLGELMLLAESCAYGAVSQGTNCRRLCSVVSGS